MSEEGLGQGINAFHIFKSILRAFFFLTNIASFKNEKENDY